MVHSKLQRLTSLSEDDFRTEVAIPLLQRMDYSNVQDTHDRNEYGKDIVCQLVAPGQTFNIAVVLKKGDLSGATKARRGVTLLSLVTEQARKAATVPANDVATKSPISIGTVIVWVSGKLTSNAKHEIAHDRALTYVNIEFWDGAKTVSLLDEHYPEYWTIGDHSIVTYYSKAKEKHSKLEDILALGSVPARHPLPSVFVPPRLALMEKTRSKQANQERKRAKQIPFSKLLQFTNRRIAIIGDLGTGKSTALRRILLQTIDINVNESQKHPLPIYIRFRNLDFSYDDPITNALSKEFRTLVPSDRETDISDLLQHGNIMVLIDGLDELESEELINEALQTLNSFTQVFSESKVVITSRSNDALETTNMLEQFSMYRILYLNFAQVKTMIRKWFADNVDDGEKLIREISNPVTFTSIPLTPLTMAMLAAVYRGNTRDLPANLTELFDKYVGLALGQWDTNKGIESQIEWKIKRNMLCELAWKLLKSNERGMSLKNIEDLIETMLSDIGLPFDSLELLSEIIDRSGLLVTTENDVYVFKHHALFSYFAGYKLILEPDHFKIIAEHFNDMRWSRTIFFAFGINYNDPSYLQHVIENVPLPAVNYLHYAVQLGLITQASYFVSNTLKTQLVGRSLFSFVRAWDEIVDTLDKMRDSDRTRRRVTQFMELNFICANVSTGLGAPILQSPLQSLWEKPTLEHLFKDSIESEYHDAQVEWFYFFLAIASVSAMALDTFDDLLGSGKIRNPMLLACCEMQAELMLELLEVDGPEKSRLQYQINRLGKRLKGRGDVLGQLLDQTPDPIALLPDSSLEDQPE